MNLPPVPMSFTLNEPHPLSPSPKKERGNAICGAFPFAFPSPFRGGDRGEVQSQLLIGI